MKLIVDVKQRNAKMRAHTAAHLLHAEISKIFPDTKQAGSFVDNDYLRFDFSSSRNFTDQELKLIEININNIIYDGLQVIKKQMSYDQAIKMGAKAFFDDKYGNEVRVVYINDGNTDKFISIELCGGTHINNTLEIGVFKIVSQESIASGIRRINAITGLQAIEYFNQRDQLIENICNQIDVKNEKQIIEKINKLNKELIDYKSTIQSMQDQIIKNYLNESIKIKKSFNEFEILIFVDNQLDGIDFKTIINKSKEIIKNKNYIVYNNLGNFGIIINHDHSAKQIAEKYGLTGGGSDIFFQGKDLKLLNLF